MLKHFKTVSKKISIKYLGTSELDFVVEPEVKDDEFSELIREVARKPGVKNIIEIGSSGGDGSTNSFIQAIRSRSDKNEVKFICMEVSTVRFNKLKSFLMPYKLAYPYNLSSVSAREFPSAEQVTLFYKERKTKLNSFPIRTVLKWLEQDIQYVKETGRDVNGIMAIKEASGIDCFDACLIDGSEFTGAVELNYLIGAKYIFLDDTETYKCREAFERLASDERYLLRKYNPGLRNGYALFERL